MLVGSVRCASGMNPRARKREGQHSLARNSAAFARRGRSPCIVHLINIFERRQPGSGEALVAKYVWRGAETLVSTGTHPYRAIEMLRGEWVSRVRRVPRV